MRISFGIPQRKRASFDVFYTDPKHKRAVNTIFSVCGHHDEKLRNRYENRPTLTINVIPLEKRTVFTKHGLGDLAQIIQEIHGNCGIPSGPVRLLNGVQGATGGFGKEHIESHADRMRQLAGLGYTEVVAYINFVVSDPSHIALQVDGRIVLVRESGSLYHHVICQWDGDLSIWSVTTAIPKNNIRKLKVVWKK